MELTKREIFAGLALCGLLAGSEVDEDTNIPNSDSGAFAKEALEYADALLAGLG